MGARRIGIVAAAWVALMAATSLGVAEVRPSGLAAFVAAYPEHLAGVENGDLVWRDGTRMSAAALGTSADPHIQTIASPPPEDPRHPATDAVSAIDYEPIYRKMYGDCRVGEVAPRLAPVRWTRNAPDGGRIVMATEVNGVATKLQAISDALDELGPEFRTFLRPLGGTFVCRTIALSARVSLHGFGIAVDVNPAHGDYWLTAPRGVDGQPQRRSRIPPEIVEVFERHGFVWGGRWHRFDTFHFEYRPEYFVAAGPSLPDRLTSTTFTAFFGGRAVSNPPTRTASLGRVGFGPRAAGPCFRWVRQPGPRFGQCLARRAR